MSNETIKKAGLQTCDKKESDSPARVQSFPKPIYNKTPMSVLSPHVAEFVPRSLALKKKCPSNGETSTSVKSLTDKPSWEEALEDVKIKTVEGLPKKVEDGKRSNRGWWDEAPLKIEIDKTTNALKANHGIKGLSERTHRQTRDGTKSYPWQNKPSSAEMDSNWRLRPSDKPKENKLVFARDKPETRKKHFQGVAEEKGHSIRPKSFADKRFSAERSGKEESESVLDVMDGQQQSRQGARVLGARRGSGRGRGRIAWMNKAQSQNVESRNSDEAKDPMVLDQNNVKRIEFGSNDLNQIENTVSKQTSKSGSAKQSDLDFMREEKDMDGSTATEDDGWIVVGNKKKMDEHKDRGSKRKETVVINEDRFGTKTKEIYERDGKKSVINSQQKLEKLKQKREQKKGRKTDSTEQETKTVQDKEIITAKDLGSEDKFQKEYRKAAFKSCKKGGESMESHKKTNKKTQENESKTTIKIATIQNPNQREVKLLLKKTSEGKSSSEEQTVPKDPGFNLLEGDDEFPDLAASSKAASTSLASDWLSGGSRMPIISYSAVLKAMPKPKTQPSRTVPSEEGSSVTPDKQYENENEAQSKKKKKKKKKKKAKDNEGEPKQAPQEPKKTKQPMKFDLGDWLSAIEKNPTKINKDKPTNPKKAVTIATGVLQIKVKDRPSATLRAPTVKATHSLSSADKIRHNILDSTAPVVKRGKEREVPKKKKPSQLKRIILKEREEKKKALLEEEEDQDQKPEPQSLAEECLSSEETGDDQKTEEKSLKEDSVQDVNMSRDEVITHHHGNSNDADLSSDGDQSAVPSENDIKAQIHSRRFREYCDNVMDKELNNTTLQLIEKLVMFQDRLYHKDPIKSKAKRRFVVGLREVTKHLKLKKIRLVIISPNVERIKSAGGLDDTLHNIISIAHQNGVPVVFALRRQILGRVLHKKVPVSALGVFYYDGAENEYKKLMDLTEKARDIYAQRWKAAYDELVQRIQRERAEELPCEVQDNSDAQVDTSCDQCGVESETPNKIKKGIKADEDIVSEDADKESNINKIRNVEDQQNECNRNKANEREREEESKGKTFLQKENVSEESEDEDLLGTENMWSKQVKLVRNEKEDEKQKEETKSKLLNQGEESSKNSEDKDLLDTENMWSEQGKLEQRNEKEEEKEKEETKNKLLNQGEESSENSEDEDLLDTENIWSEQVKLEQRNEKEEEKEKQETKNKLLNQGENSSEENEVPDDLGTGKIDTKKMRKHETNKKENEMGSDERSVSMEKDLEVEELL